MIKVMISNIGVSELLDLRDDILRSGLVQGADFNFSFRPKTWDNLTGYTPNWAQFDFKDEKSSMLFLLKNAHRASVIV
jgi:hypothetical protein